MFCVVFNADPDPLWVRAAVRPTLARGYLQKGSRRAPAVHVQSRPTPGSLQATTACVHSWFPQKCSSGSSCDHIFVLHTLPLCLLALPCRLRSLLWALIGCWLRGLHTSGHRGEEGLASLDKKPGPGEGWCRGERTTVPRPGVKLGISETCSPSSPAPCCLQVNSTANHTTVTGCPGLYRGRDQQWPLCLER